MRRIFATVASVVVVVGVAASAALAGEVKGPPYKGEPVPGGIAGETNSTPAPSHARSECAYSGLNDYDSDLGQNEKQVQTPADGPPGAPGLGFTIEVAPGVTITLSCRGNVAG